MQRIKNTEVNDIFEQTQTEDWVTTNNSSHTKWLINAMQDNKKQDGRGRHGKCGRKKSDNPRNKNMNIRLNNQEWNNFEKSRERKEMSQADFLVFLVDNFTPT